MSDFSIHDLFQNPWGEHNPLAVLGFDRQMALELKRRPDIFEQAVQRMFRLRMIIFHPDHSNNEYMATMINRAMEHLGSTFFREEILEEFLRQTSGEQRTQLVAAKRSVNELEAEMDRLQSSYFALQLRYGAQEKLLAQRHQEVVRLRVMRSGTWIASSITYSDPRMPKTTREQFETVSMDCRRLDQKIFPVFVGVRSKLGRTIFLIEGDGVMYSLMDAVTMAKSSPTSIELLDRFLKRNAEVIIGARRQMQHAARERQIDSDESYRERAKLLLSSEDKIRAMIADFLEQLRRGERRWRKEILAWIDKPVLLSSEELTVTDFVYRLVYTHTKRYSSAAHLRKALEKVEDIELRSKFSTFRKFLDRPEPVGLSADSAESTNFEGVGRELLRVIASRVTACDFRYLGAIHADLVPSEDVRQQLEQINPCVIADVLPGLRPMLSVSLRLATVTALRQEGDDWVTTVKILGEVEGVWTMPDALLRIATKYDKHAKGVADLERES